MKTINYLMKTEKNVKPKTITTASDLHINKKTKPERIQEILDEIDKTKPTHILIPGDLYNVDYETVYGDNEIVSDFLNEATDIAPVYYVPGDSELKTYILPEKLTNHNNPNLHILCDTSNEFIETGNIIHQYTDTVVDDDITISGIKLPQEYYNMYEFQKITYLKKLFEEHYFDELNNIDKDKLNILLCHDPFIIKCAEYLKMMDVVISGHNHGGLFPEDKKKLLKFLKADIDKLYPTYVEGFRKSFNTEYVISNGVTKFHPDMGILQYLEKKHDGSIDVIRCRKR